MSMWVLLERELEIMEGAQDRAAFIPTVANNHKSSLKLYKHCSQVASPIQYLKAETYLKIIVQ